MLPEFDSVRRVVESATVEEWLRSTCCNHPDVLQYKDDIDISSFLEGEGKPVCVRGAVTDWNNHWNGLNSLKRLGGASQVVRANDRAPARHADALSGDGQKQQTIYLPFYAYLEYLATFSERTIEESALQVCCEGPVQERNMLLQFTNIPHQYRDIVCKLIPCSIQTTHHST